MKFIIPVFLLVLIALDTNAQTSKFYMTGNGNRTSDSSSALYYVLIDKLDDTAYMATEYNIHHELMVRGVFKDESLSTPNGKFYYYESRLDPYSENRDIVSYLQQSGYYSNGMKQGPWTKYFANGKKLLTEHYVNDKLNGLHQEFDEDGVTVLSEGNYVDGKKDGEWKTYQYGLDKPSTSYFYSLGKKTRTVFHYHYPTFSRDFMRSVEKSLKENLDTLKDKSIEVTLFISDKGKIDSARLATNVSSPLQDVIIRAFLIAPRVKAADLDGVPIKAAYLFNLRLFREYDQFEEKSDAQRNQQKNDILSRHINDIGRGLNSVGIGKPVN